MNALILLLIVIIIYIIFDNAKKRDNLETYRRQNNASFVAEVEEYAKWSETIFKVYCSIAGINTALSELENAKPSIELYEYNDGFVMPKIIVNRRGHLGTRFKEVFDNLKDPAAIEALKLHYQLPLDEQIRFDKATRKHFSIGGEMSIRDDYYKTLYQILYLNVYLSLLDRQYNIGKSNIREDPITEHHLIQETIKFHPWLSGDFRRY